MPHAGFTLTLDDGTPIRLRPVVPSDAEAIRRGYREMSHSSRYMRFFTVGAEMSVEQARYFTELDQRDHVAWCAVEPVSNRRGYGIARFVRDPARPDVADFAVAVIDQTQHRKLGTILLATLYLLAEAGGITELRGDVLPENPVMPMWLPRLGATITGSGDPSYRIIRWPIGDKETMAAMDDCQSFADWLTRLRPLVLGQPSTTQFPARG